MRINLLSTAAAAAIAAALAPSPTFAQPKTLYVAAYGGSFEQTMRKEVIPPFEKKYGLKIEYVAGNSTDTLAKLQAQKLAASEHCCPRLIGRMISSSESDLTLAAMQG